MGVPVVRFPFVSAARVDAIVAGWTMALDMVEQRASTWERIASERKAELDALLEKYDSLAKLMVGAQAHVPEVPEVEPVDDMPPQVVLDAMRRISPYRDKTYDANWAYWEANKGRAKDHPEDFANEILEGFTDWTTQTR